MTQEERIELAKAQGRYRRPLEREETVTFHPAAAKMMGNPVSGVVMWDAPTAHKGLGSRMVKVYATYSDGTRAIFNVRRGYCYAQGEEPQQ